MKIYFSRTFVPELSNHKQVKRNCLHCTHISKKRRPITGGYICDLLVSEFDIGEIGEDSLRESPCKDFKSSWRKL